MRHKRTRDIVIELTSLLDVVMILIFAVMIKNAQLVEANNQKVSELWEENAAMQEENAAIQAENAAMQDSLTEYKEIQEELANASGKIEEGVIDSLLGKLHSTESQLDAYEFMDDIVVCYNIGLENYSNNTARRLTYSRVSDKNPKPPLKVRRTDVDEWRQAVNRLTLDLSEYINQEQYANVGDKYIYLIFSVDKTKIYSNDFDDIEKVLLGLETKFGDKVRYKLNILESE